MKLARSLTLSRRALSAHKLRSFLALAGLSIGIAGLIAVRAVGDGARRAAVDAIDRMGTNLLVVQAARSRPAVGRARQDSFVTTLTLADWEALQSECRLVARAAPAQDRVLEVKYAGTMTRTTVLGSTADYVRVSNSRVAAGRPFTGVEAEAAARVAVLGDQAARNLFGPRDPLGEAIRIGRVPFVVVGVLAPKGVGPNGANEDDKILIPVKTALRRVFNLDYIKAVFLTARSRGEMDAAAAEVTRVLRGQHDLDRRGRPDDFTIRSQATVLAAAEAASASLTAMALGIGAVSLAVGGIGILSLMILSVRERTPEIGLRMAVGSRPRDILVQFMFEALALGLAGGAAGVALGVAASAAIGRFTEWQTAISAGPAGMAALLSPALGLVAGIYPAMRAASLDPIVALRAE